MAAASTSTTAELLTKLYQKPFVNSLDLSQSLWGRIKKVTPPEKGTHVRWKLTVGANDSATSYTEEETYETPGHTTYAEASTPYKQNRVIIEVTGLQQAATEGKGGYAPVLSEESKYGLEALKDHINDQMLSASAPGNSGADMDGLPYIISDTGSYAGITRATATYWKSYVLDNSSNPRDISISLMQQVMTEMFKEARKGKIKEILCSKADWYNYGNLMTEYRRYQSQTKLDGGYDALDFEGIPVIAIDGMAAGAMYFIDPSYWEYCILKNFQTDPYETSKDSEAYVVKHYAQLVCKHPGTAAKIVDLTTS